MRDRVSRLANNGYLACTLLSSSAQSPERRRERTGEGVTEQKRKKVTHNGYDPKGKRML